eukprot:CAMPEP_0113267162 /NCGR_PEP_ID=MMETSP0008_2-20120614/20455_1 /TAXON_ID=97485 /ORGANISM="Prymnesium parvum" /LENGTH=109 /DNA_ID=CAMNT_0000116163 /DNA_START=786 /DNA_END=1116 /DNA_ORIENTATION=+ /assembly_acc=CAM_ASM_000153
MVSCNRRKLFHLHDFAAEWTSLHFLSLESDMEPVGAGLGANEDARAEPSGPVVTETDAVASLSSDRNETIRFSLSCNESVSALSSVARYIETRKDLHNSSVLFPNLSLG